MIKANSSIELLVKFKASNTGPFESMLGFEVAGGGVMMSGREIDELDVYGKTLNREEQP